MELNETLRKIRREKNFPQDKLAEAIGVDSTTYGRYEKGDSQIKFEHVVKMAEFYGLTLDELYHYFDSKTPATSRSVREPVEMYATAARKSPDRDPAEITVSVALDGTPETLTKWIKRLSAINAVLQ